MYPRINKHNQLDKMKNKLLTMAIIAALMLPINIMAEDIIINQLSEFGEKQGTTGNSYYTLVKGNTYTLNTTISVDGYLYIPAAGEGTVTINLNSKTLRRNDIQYYENNGFVIKNEGALTIIGKNDGADNGIISGGKNYGNGGGIYNSGELSIINTTISDNKAEDSFGSGIYNTGTVNITGGSIESNYGATKGGGIYNGGTLTIDGTVIKSNTTTSGDGAGIYNDGTLNIKGALDVSLNTIANQGRYSNIYLTSTHSTINIADQLTCEDNKIGVSMESPSIFTSGLTSTSSSISKFKSDDDRVELSADGGEAKLQTYWSQLQEQITAAYSTGDHLVTLDKSYYAYVSDGPLTVTGTVIINLNGKTLNRNLNTAKEDGMVIKNTGNLTIIGSGDINGGHNKDGNGGGIYNTGSLTLNGNGSSPINITSNYITSTSTHNGAGIYHNGTSLSMQGYIIINNNKSNNVNNNVYLNTGDISIASDLNSNTRIGVIKDGYNSEPKIITSGLGTHGTATNFTADLGGGSGIDNSTGEIIIGPVYIITMDKYLNGAATHFWVKGYQDDFNNGTITAVKGEKITVSISDYGQVPASLNFRYDNNSDHYYPQYIRNGGSYTFEMPAYDVQVYVVFKPGGYCGDPTVNDGKNVKYYGDGNTLHFKSDGTQAMNNTYTSASQIPWSKESTIIDFDDQITSISPYAFYGSSITGAFAVSKNVKDIGDYAFGKCNSLTAINVDGDNANYSSNDGVLFNKIGNTLISYPAGKTFEGNSYSVGGSVTTILPQAFAWNTHLSSVSCTSVTTIDNEAFAHCTGLTSASIIGATTIGDKVFNRCTSLTSFSVPVSLTTLGEGVFTDCTGLTEISVTTGNTAFKAVDGVLFNIAGTTLICYPAGKTGTKYKIPKTEPTAVTTLAPYAFQGNTSLTRIYVPHESPLLLGGTSMFDGNNNNCYIMVPANKLTDYQSADKWSTYSARIKALSLTDATITLSYNEVAYDGSAKEPTVTVNTSTGDQLEQTTHYTVSYSNNTEVGTATVTINGAEGSDYEGLYGTNTFNIYREFIVGNDVGSYITYYPSEDLRKPTNAANTVSFAVYKVTDVNWESSRLTLEEIDYIPRNTPVILSSNNTYHKGTTLKFYKKEGAGDPPAVSSVFKGIVNATELNQLQTPGDGKTYDIYILKEGVFYRVTNGTTTNKLPERHCYLRKDTNTGGPSELPVEVTASGSSGQQIIIGVHDNGSLTHTSTSGSTVTLTATPNTNYYLDKIVLEYVEDLNNADARTRSGSTTLPIRDTYTINKNTTSSYALNHYGGTYTFTKPNNSSSVVANAYFVACTDISGATIQLKDGDNGYDSREYKGTAYDVIVKVGGTKKTIDYDYTITSGAASYTYAGDHPTTITGCGIYCGTANATPKITKKDVTITAKAQNITYSNSITTGTNQVTHTSLASGDILSAITLMPSNINAGTHDIIPSGASISKNNTDVTSNYTLQYENGSLTINPLNIGSTASGTKAEITLTGPDSDADGLYYNWDGNVKSPAVSVTYNSAAFASYDTPVTTAEYFPEVVDNKKADIYTVTVTFNGNYTGSISKSYQIRPKIELNNAYKWLTFYEPTYNMKATSGLNTYTVQSVTFSGGTGSVVLSSRDGVISKTVPMMLYRTGEDYIFYPVLERKTTTSWTGVLQNFKHNDSAWDLSTNFPAGKDIWILVNDNFIRTNSGTMPAGKCYLELNHTDFPSSITTQASARLRIVVGNDDDDTTGINDVEINTEEIRGEFYNLNGQRVQTPSKGIYIVNGKKVFIK